MPWLAPSVVGVAVLDRTIERLDEALTEEAIRGALAGFGIADRAVIDAAVANCQEVFAGEPTQHEYPSLYCRLARVASTEETTPGYAEYEVGLEVVAATTTAARDAYQAAALLSLMEDELRVTDAEVETLYEGLEPRIHVWNLEHESTQFGLGADAASVLGMAMYTASVTVDRTT